MSGADPLASTGADGRDPAPDATESILVEMLRELTDELRRGGAPDVEWVGRRHPELAGELRHLWAAAAIAEEMARGALGPETVSWGSADQVPAPAPDLGAPPSRPSDGSRFGECELIEELGRAGWGSSTAPGSWAWGGSWP